ncbi:MAG: undecaprenyl-diphosphate phosphatase [Gemmatimonadetes bacterium]|nr:undecaprenyl-diphosphate phosphatase [Gemmatimonadota bacterium]
MTVWQALVLGLVQGLAEFLPISSSAHLALVPWLMGWQDPGLAFDVALHLGTLVALAWYFRQEWGALTMAGLRVLRRRRVEDEAERRAMFVLLATIPAGIAGLALGDLAEHTLRHPVSIAIALIVLGTLLWWADRSIRSARPLKAMTWRDAGLVGLAQACALIPGVSRSGSTITAARALGFDRSSAATFSFLLSFPITLAAVVHKAPEAMVGGVTAPLVVGVLAAGVSSGVAIAVLLRYVSKRSYGVFAAYRWVAGVLVLVLWWMRR